MFFASFFTSLSAGYCFAPSPQRQLELNSLPQLTDSPTASHGQSVGKSVGQIAVGPCQHSNFWFRVPSGSMINIDIKYKKLT
jgi:hypothetical protein